MRTLVIIPTYNERDSLPLLFARLRECAPGSHLLVVDDGSPDGTADVAEELFAGAPQYHLMRRTGVRGLGRSYIDGYRWALERGYARAVQMDCDLSHDPGYIAGLLAASGGADVVIGSRYCAGGGVQNWPMHREMLSRFANRYVAAIVGLPVRDATAGFRVYTRRALERIPLDTIASNGYSFQVEMTYWAHRAGLRMVESPIVFVDRLHGRSKMTKKVILEAMILPWRLRAMKQDLPEAARSKEAGG